MVFYRETYLAQAGIQVGNRVYAIVYHVCEQLWNAQRVQVRYSLAG